MSSDVGESLRRYVQVVINIISDKFGSTNYSIYLCSLLYSMKYGMGGECNHEIAQK